MRPVGTSSRDRLTALAVAVFVGVVFLPTLRCGFVNWDDDKYVTDNPLVTDGPGVANAARAFTEPVFFNWAPLTILSYQADAAVFGLDPRGFHLTSVVIHALACGLMYLVLVRLTGERGRSLAATLLFAVHPLRVESVTWIADRKDVLCVFCMMLALLAYERFCRGPAPARLAVVVAAMLAGLMAKSSLVTLPALLLVLDVWPLGRLTVPGIGRPVAGGSMPGRYPQCSAAVVLAEKLPLVVISLIFAALTIRLLAMPIAAASDKPLLTSRVPNAIYAVVWYLGKSIWPVGLCATYNHAGDRAAAFTVVLCAVFIAGLCLAAWRLGRSRPYIAFGLAWFLISIGPLLGLVQVTETGYADRYSYAPHFGLAVAFVWGAADLFGALRLPRPAVAALVAGVVSVLVALTERQIPVWRTSETLWHHVLEVDPDNWMAHVKVGQLLHEQGRSREAEEHLLRAKDGTGAATFVLRALANFYLDTGDFARAVECRDLVLQFDPHADGTRQLVARMRVGPPYAADPTARAAADRGLAAGRAGRFDEALAAFHDAIAADPAWPNAHANAGLALLNLGRDAEAEAALRRAIELNPFHADFRVTIAQLLCRSQRWGEAAGHLAAALASDPFDEEARRMADRCRRVNATPK